MIIRNAKPEDAIALQAIRQLGEQLIAQRLATQASGATEFLVVEAAGQLVSFVVLKYFGKETYPHIPDIEDLYTKVEERGKGYATTCYTLEKAAPSHAALPRSVWPPVSIRPTRRASFMKNWAMPMTAKCPTLMASITGYRIG